MNTDTDTRAKTASPGALTPDFLDRLEQSLPQAETLRRRQRRIQQGQKWLPLALLVGPIIAWKLLDVSSGSGHIAIDALAGVVAALDVCVHVDSGILAYLNLQALPTIVCVLLLSLVAAGLIGTAEPRDDP